MEMVFVPAGPFIMGSNDVTNEKPEREVYLDAYWIDKYEVSNAQYAKCVEAGGCKARVANNSSKRVSYYGNSDFNDYPVIWVDWNQASAYCEWAGGKLPTEAQWEKAARGLNRNEYPWGNESPICDLANYNQGSNNEPKHCIGDTTAVGSSPGGASYYGVMDMAGNVWEWVRDWYALYNTSEINNPTGPSTGLDSKVIRGGSWGNDSKEIRSAFRHIQNPVEGTAFIGFRCVFPAD
jgi:serine/threonine-protein kinase